MDIAGICLAEHAGFCFGVRRAVETAEKSAPAVTLGPIIHNPQVVKDLEAMGVRPIEGAEAADEGARVVIRSHGIGKAEFRALEEKGCEIIDATCPFVTRIHETAQSAQAAGVALIVIGEARHPEVAGILGWTDGPAWAVMTKEDVEALPPLESAWVVSQTTMSLARFDEVCGLLKERIPDIRIHKTICPATRDRQREAAEMAARCDVMVVVGGRESSNSRKLYDLARETCPRTVFIESARELRGIALSPSDTIGITAGASTPD